MSSGKVKCTCGWSWNKSDSSKKDMYICHECGRDNSNNMKNGGWLDSYADGGTMQEYQENYNDPQVSLPEGFVGMGNNTKGRNYSPAWGGQFEDGGEIPMAQNGKATRADSLFLLNNNKVINNLLKQGYKWQDKKKGGNKNQIRWKDEYDYQTSKLPRMIKNDIKHKQKTKPYNTYIDKRGKFVGTQDWLFSGGEDYYLPKQYIHPNIVPQFEADLLLDIKNKPLHRVYSFGYDDLAITPFDMLTPEQKKLRVEKYGTDGVPKSYINANKEKPELQPEVKAVKISPIEQSNISTDLEINTAPMAKMPSSFDVSMQRYNMEGSSDYYQTNEEGVDYERAMEIKAASDAYNKYIQEKYGNKEALKNPKAAERLKQLRSEFDITPKYQMGGSIPGAVGFSYARTQSPAPSNGPYAKKTKASAQNGETLQYGTPEYKKAYDENRVAYYDKDSDTYINQELAPIEVQGRVRDKGFWEQYVDKIVSENRGASPLEAAIGVPISAVSSLPQLAATYAFTDKVQRPSEAMDIKNPYLAMGTDFVLDPFNVTGTGVLTKEQALARLAASKESGLLSNAWKLNPKAYQYNLPKNTMWRGIGKEGMEDATQSGVFRPKNAADTKRVFTTPNGTEFHFGKSFDKTYYSPDFKIADRYGKSYIAEVPNTSADFTRRYSGKDWSYHTNKQIPISEGRILEKNWLQGYKPIEIPKQNNAQSSFIKQDLSEGNNIKYSFTDKQGNNIGTFSGRKNPEGIYVNGIEINPELRRQGLASKIYKDIAKDLQSKNEGTLFSRSTQHQFTDKDKLGRSIAPANKLWENLVNKGEAEKFVEGMSHTYKIKPLKEGGVIKDDLGQWAHPGEITEIGSNQITMQGVPYPVLGVSDEGDVQMMYPEEEYEFDGESVTEYPMAKNGLRQEQKGLVNLDQLTNFTNYNTKQPGGWLDKY